MTTGLVFRICLPAIAVAALLLPAFAADNPKVLLGTWNGKATGPQGGPPTGDITVVFEKDGSGLKGTFSVKSSGGAQYTGKLSDITLADKVFTAKATFQLGENPLEVVASGPLKGKMISGSIVVSVQGQKMGDGTFSIAKGVTAPPPKK